MPAPSYDGYPFRPLGEWRQRLISSGTSPERALSSLNNELATGELELKQPLPFRRLRLISRDRLELETADDRLILADDLEARYRPEPAEPVFSAPPFPCPTRRGSGCRPE